jgi:cytochrome P450
MNETPIFPLPCWRPAVVKEDLSVNGPRVGAAKIQLPRGQQVWLISSYDLCRQVLSHPDLRSDHTHPSYPDVFPIKKSRKNGSPVLATYSGMDHPEHTLHRRLIAEEFSKRAVEHWRARVFAIAAHALDAMRASGASFGELVSQYAEPVASTTIFEFLGVPPSWRPELARLARILLGGPGSDREVAQAASKAFRARLEALIAEKEARPGEDLLGRLTTRYQREGLYSRAQFVEFAGGLITAGHQTAITMIALSAAVLIERPAERGQMFADKRFFAQGVEELLRYLSVADLAPARVAAADVEIAGLRICEGEGVIASTAHANYDAERFVDAARFDIHRGDLGHMAFGYGVHKCLGQHLARLELEAGLIVLFQALPHLQLSDAAPLKLRREQAILTVEEVGVSW